MNPLCHRRLQPYRIPPIGDIAVLPAFSRMIRSERNVAVTTAVLPGSRLIGESLRQCMSGERGRCHGYDARSCDGVRHRSRNLSLRFVQLSASVEITSAGCAEGLSWWCRRGSFTPAPTPNRTCKISKHPAFQTVSINYGRFSTCGTPGIESGDFARWLPACSWRSCSRV